MCRGRVTVGPDPPMLTQPRLESLIRGDALEITYYFDPFAIPPSELSSPDVEPDRADSEATQAFHRLMFGERLGLTAGPLVLSHTHPRVRGRKRYKSFAGVYDLRETGGQIELKPGESITINTIERVRLDGSLAAIILPRLTHATAGVVLTPSYIDPHWDGVLVLHLANVSRQAHTLRFGEAVAVCRFYKIDGEALDEEFRRRFAEKSHHHGQSWSRLLTSDADPFPMRKRATLREALADRTIRLARSGAIKLAGAGIGVLAVLGMAIGYGKLTDQLGRLDSVDDRVESLADSPLARASAGQVEIRIPQGARDGRAAVALSQVRGGAVALADAVGDPPGVRVRATLDPSPSGTGARLVLRVHRSDGGRERTVTVRWTVL